MTLSKICRNIRNSNVFQNFITFTIIVAGIQVGVESYETFAQNHLLVLQIIDIAILVIFVLEIAIKIIAEGRKPWNYFMNSWNIFDFIIVVFCFLPIGTRFAAVIRLVRIFRVLRLITAFPQLRMIVSGLFKSIPAMGYIFVLLMLHFYIYATIGTTLFSQNDPFHFGDLHTSMLTLFRVITLEDWTDIMYANIYGCDKVSYEGSDLCTDPKAMPMAAIIYFVSFVFTGAMIVLDLFIGVIMTSMDEAKQENMVRKLLQKKDDNSLSPREEIVLLENQLLRLTGEINALNNRIFHLLEKGQLRKEYEKTVNKESLGEDEEVALKRENI